MQTIEFNHEWKMRLQNRFLTYVKIYSTSDPESEATPSSPQQWYIAKYISKNIDGYALDGQLDNDTGRPLKDTAAAVTAWASTWRIPQFKTVGLPTMGAYRELRKLPRGVSIADEFDERVEAARAAADDPQPSPAPRICGVHGLRRAPGIHSRPAGQPRARARPRPGALRHHGGFGARATAHRWARLDAQHRWLAYAAPAR